MKSVTSRIEVDIEKNREEANWLKVIELAEQLKEKSPDYVCLSDFLIGEGKLENFLDECPPIEANVTKAKVGLIDAKRYLNQVTDELGIKAGVAMDAHLLLGKLHYASGQYSDSLKHFKEADLHNLSEKRLPLRSLRIVAESYAIKGLCLQKDSSATSKFKKVEREEEMVKCFDLASDLSLLYMQKLEKEQTPTIPNTGTHSPQPMIVPKSMSVILEQALQEAPLVLLHQNKPEQALERYRASLCAVETQSVNNARLKFLCQLAELLLEGKVGDNYKASFTNLTSNKTALWKPKCYSFMNQFIPRNEYEETILVLLVAESLAVRNAVLSQSPEFKDVRLLAYQEARIVYDLLALATVRWGQATLLQESLERAMKFSFDDAYLWKQHALSLLSIGRYEPALSTLIEVMRLEKNNASNFLLAAKVCYEHVNQPVKGTNYSIQAKDIEVANPTGLLGRCCLYIGIGYHLQAEICLLKKKKKDFSQKALENFQSAVDLDPNDHLSHYYLALQLADNNDIVEAHKHVKLSLDLRPENSSALHLFTLLLTAEQQFKCAVSVLDNALEEYPDSLNLLYVKANLELHEEGGEKALITAKHMLELWKNLYEGQTNSDVPECDRKSDTRSVFQIYTSEMSDKDSSSLQFHNIAVSKVEQALSEVASSLSSFCPRPGPHRAWLLQVEVWLLLANLYLTLDQPDDVILCIQEATTLYPLSHHIMHMKGLLHMHKEEWAEARLCFQNAVAINPQHVKSLQQLGLVYHYLDLQGLAETTLREAAKIDPKNHVTWYNLGKVLEAAGEYEKASNAMATAILEEKSNPILPYNSVPLYFD